MTSTSICIPRVFPNISSNQIAHVFESLGLGRIERIDLIPFINSKNEHLNRAFVYIQWNDTEAAKHLHEKIHDPDETAKIVYQDPWFWMLLPNKNPMTSREASMERRVDAIETKLLDMTEAYNFQHFILRKQAKILTELSNIVMPPKQQAKKEENQSGNVEYQWFMDSSWLDKVLACEDVKENPIMKEYYDAKELQKIGRTGPMNYNPSYTDFVELCNMRDSALELKKLDTQEPVTFKGESFDPPSPSTPVEFGEFNEKNTLFSLIPCEHPSLYFAKSEGYQFSSSDERKEHIRVSGLPLDENEAWKLINETCDTMEASREFVEMKSNQHYNEYVEKTKIFTQEQEALRNCDLVYSVDVRENMAKKHGADWYTKYVPDFIKEHILMTSYYDAHELERLTIEELSQYYDYRVSEEEDIRHQLSNL
jgi:hypothetical protein